MNHTKIVEFMNTIDSDETHRLLLIAMVDPILRIEDT